MYQNQAGNSGGGNQNYTDQTGGGGGGNHAANPWTGLAGVLSFLQGGDQMGGFHNSLNANVYNQLMNGYEGQTVGGKHYNVQGANGALSGLSPWAAHWIAQNLLKKNEYQAQSLTGLTGDDLFKATIANSLGASQANSYTLANPNVTTADYLSSLFGDHGQTMDPDGVHSFYNKGYNATGGHAPVAAADNPLAGHPMAKGHPHYAAALKAGYKGTFKAWNKAGRPKK